MAHERRIDRAMMLGSVSLPIAVFVPVPLEAPIRRTALGTEGSVGISTPDEASGAITATTCEQP